MLSIVQISIHVYADSCANRVVREISLGLCDGGRTDKGVSWQKLKISMIRLSVQIYQYHNSETVSTHTQIGKSEFLSISQILCLFIMFQTI